VYRSAYTGTYNNNANRKKATAIEKIADKRGATATRK
jgi:hypothetical protein